MLDRTHKQTRLPTLKRNLFSLAAFGCTIVGLNTKLTPDKTWRPCMIEITVNGQTHHLDIASDTPLLWALRDKLGLTGTKYGCGMALCGACTVHVDGEPIRSCVTPVSSVASKKITTIEGLSADSSHPLQVAWIAEEVPQCGYCQSGQIMTAAALLAKSPTPSDDDIDNAMNGNLCRCGTYSRIRKAIHRAAEMKGSKA